jgi:hypothetical protein
MALTTYMQKQALDWILGGATGTQPTGRFLQFATGSPNINGASDGPFTSRLTVTFAAGASPAGSKSNANALTSATCTVAATVVGWNLYDANAGGNRLAFGTLTASRTLRSATDNCALPVGVLTITLT